MDYRNFLLVLVACGSVVAIKVYDCKLLSFSITRFEFNASFKYETLLLGGGVEVAASKKSFYKNGGNYFKKVIHASVSASVAAAIIGKLVGFQKCMSVVTGWGPSGS